MSNVRAFDERLKANESNRWPESMKEASCDVCDTIASAKKILIQEVGEENFTTADILSVSQMILMQNDRLEKVKREEE